MGGKQVVASTLERLAEVIGWLEQGMQGVECTGLAAMLRQLAGQLAASADAIPAGLLGRIENVLRLAGPDAVSPAWCVAAKAKLGEVWGALAEPGTPLLDDDTFARYRDTLAMDDAIQYADAFALPESAGAEQGCRAKPPECGVPRMAGNLPEETRPVKLGAAAPAACRLGGEFTARFVAYPPDDEVEVAELLHKLSPRSTSHLDLGLYVWKPGTKVNVSLSGRGLTVDPPVQEMVWQGERVLLDFDVEVPDSAEADTVVLKFDVAIDGFIVARLRLDLEIGVDGAATRVAQAEAARTAFASYSSQDRQRVLDRVAALQIDTGMDIFLDCLSLHPGQHWEDRLAEEIRRRDLFLLFWSAAAAQSQWVEWEWRRALAEGKKEEMEIQPLENGITPPPELSDRHFGDPAMAVRAAGAPST